MSTHLTSWEYQLLREAHDVLHSHIPLEPIQGHETQLAKSYEHCANITNEHSRTFYLASSLLPQDQQQAARALYAFCRVSDDIVDNTASESRTADLNQWRQRSLRTHPIPDDLVTLAWSDARARFGIPRRYAEQLIDGVGSDIEFTEYQTFTELTRYCYGVASTVGLMTMHITGYTGKEAIPYAIKLGVALQLTNILRDVGADWEMGRFYLPIEELEAIDLTKEDIANKTIDHRWRAFMRFQIARTRRLYKEALPGVQMLGKDGRFAIQAAAELYQAILEDIEKHDYDVFNRRAHTTKLDKLQMLPGIWLRSR